MHKIGGGKTALLDMKANLHLVLKNDIFQNHIYLLGNTKELKRTLEDRRCTLIRLRNLRYPSTLSSYISKYFSISLIVSRYVDAKVMLMLKLKYLKNVDWFLDTREYFFSGWNRICVTQTNKKNFSPLQK